jgi:ribonuclease HI
LPDNDVDVAELVAGLRRLSHATAGHGVLYLPAEISAPEAIHIIGLTLRALEQPPPTKAKPARDCADLQIHLDGAARGNPGPAGVGVLILGSDGKVIERICRSIGETTNNVAEYRALLLALERARALGCADLEVYSDSELVVRQIQGRYRVKHPALRDLHAAAREHIGHFRRFVIHHVPREQNAEADGLANRAIDEACSQGRRKTRVAGGSSPGGGAE